MGNLSSTAKGVNVAKGCNLELVLSVLPVVASVSKSLADNTNKRDKRHGYLINIQTSAHILMGHLNEIEEDGATGSFASQINQLADCLEEIFSDEVMKRTKSNVSNARFR